MNKCMAPKYDRLASLNSMMAAAVEMASDIAGKSPVAVQGTKVNLNYAREHSVQDGLDFAVRLEAEIANSCHSDGARIFSSQAAWNSFSLQSGDVVKAAMAAMAKEKAEFSKL